MDTCLSICKENDCDKVWPLWVECTVQLIIPNYCMVNNSIQNFSITVHGVFWQLQLSLTCPLLKVALYTIPNSPDRGKNREWFNLQHAHIHVHNQVGTYTLVMICTLFYSCVLWKCSNNNNIPYACIQMQNIKQYMAWPDARGCNLDTTTVLYSPLHLQSVTHSGIEDAFEQFFLVQIWCYLLPLFSLLLHDFL